MGKKKRSKTKDREVPPWRREECVPVTLEQLQLANKVAHAPATGGMVRKSFAASFEEAREAGELEPGKSYLTLTDLPINHAALAILDTVPDKTPEGERLRRSLLWRVIFAAPEVYGDPRAKKYLTQDEHGKWIAWPLVEAVAKTAMIMPAATPLDAIFEMADKLAVEGKWDASLPTKEFEG
jgi:hypothetical protein